MAARSFVDDVLLGGVAGSGLTPEAVLALTLTSTLDSTDDLLILYQDSSGELRSIRWTGRLEVTNDGANYSVTPYTPFGRNLQQRFTAAQDHIVAVPAGLSISPPTYGRFFAPPANTLTIKRVAGSGVSINGVADDGYTWVVPPGGSVRWLTYDTNSILVWGDIALSTLDAARSAITNYRSALERVTGAQTLSAANFDAGAILLHTGAGATYTVPSRLLSTETDVVEELTVKNRGSGAITWSASSVTLVGDTGTLAAGESATLEWDHNGTTQTVEIRTL